MWHPPAAYGFLHEAIATARSERELDRFAGLAMAHFIGGRRRSLEGAVEVRRQQLQAVAASSALGRGPARGVGPGLLGRRR